MIIELPKLPKLPNGYEIPLVIRNIKSLHTRGKLTHIFLGVRFTSLDL
jgi:hypothetical protein